MYLENALSWLKRSANKRLVEERNSYSVVALDTHSTSYARPKTNGASTGLEIIIDGTHAVIQQYFRR